MHHRWLVLILALGAFLAGGVDSSRGETPEVAATRHYGAGVHAYHQGQYDKAVRELDLASGLAPDDARIFLIRGAAKMRLGRVDDAKSDFHYGASVELASRQRDVGVALERIQGPDRLVLESYRRQARAAATASEEALRAHEKAVAAAKSAEAASAKTPGDKPKADPPTNDRPAAKPAPQKPAAAKPDDEDQASDFDDPFGSDTDEADTDEAEAEEPAMEEAVEDASAEDEASEEPSDEEASGASSDGDTDSDTAGEVVPRPKPAPRVSSFRINNLPPDASDPFANDAQNTLGRGAIEEASEPKDLADDSADGDSTEAATSTAKPAGTASGGGTSRGKPGDDGDEPLEGFDGPAGDAPQKAGGGPVGAAFRALMRSVVPPGVSLDNLPAIGPGGAAPSGMPGGFEATDGGVEAVPGEEAAEPFDVPAAPANEEPANAESGDAFEEEDPFSTDAPEDAGDSPTEEATDEATEEADDDPFGS